MIRTLHGPAVALIAATLAVAPVACGRDPTPARHDAGEHAGIERPRAARPFDPSVGFHSHRQLTEHFEKHGAEFGAASPREYLAEAQRLRDAPVGGPVVELVRDDGVITRFDRGTGAFIAFDEDGTIRTFFKPNVGEEYFRRQARRHEDRP